MIIIEKDFHGRKFTIETGRIAKQASGSVIVSYGESIVMVTACLGAAKDGDFVPLTVDYQEKTYAAGKIPGGFFKREGRLSEKEILVSRLIDRPCRPLFPEGFNNELQVIATVISAEPESDTDILAVCGASAALTISEAPFQGPIAAVRVIRHNGKLLINPTKSQITKCDMNFVVAGTKDAIVMVEGGAQEVPEAEVLEALFFAQAELQHIIKMQEDLAKKAGKAKIEVVKKETFPELVEGFKKLAKAKVAEGIRIKEKLARRDFLTNAKAEITAALVKEDDAEAKGKQAKIAALWEGMMYDQVREMAANDRVRIDGRDFKTIRPISVETGWLPRTHGSALFTRGETQAIVVATLGTSDDAQRMDNLVGEETKNFMLHYNFPPYSVGETKPLRGPGRREIGHGALAERAITAVLPKFEEFPYVMRVVSEITESNGSSSMATTCGASLSLMDAGVPLKAPVAGIAMGLIKHNDKFVVLSDILGDEDHLGDMDFKVCGTSKGITALQMDIKIQGLEKEIVRQALDQALEGRLHVLSEMAKVISEHKKDLSRFAPKIVTLQIHQDKIRDLIGPGGKTIKSITESCSVKIEVNDSGKVSIASSNQDNINAALQIIKSLTEQAEIGKIYKGIVKRIADFGAFVEIFPGTDGLIHISQLADQRVERVTDILDEGDEVMVKVIDVDRQGKVRLSRKEAMDDMKARGEQ